MSLSYAKPRRKTTVPWSGRFGLHSEASYLGEVRERLSGYREPLQGILSVNLTLVGLLAQNEEVKGLSEASLSQNEEVKKISAWAAILFAPTRRGWL